MMCHQCETLAQENEQLKEKVEELTVDLQIIKEEIATAGHLCIVYMMKFARYGLTS